MAAAYYSLELDNDRGLVSAPSAQAPTPMPAEAIKLLACLRDMVDRVRLHVHDERVRTGYLSQLLAAGRTGLQDGNLDTAASELDALKELGLNVHYFAVRLDENDDLRAAPAPWAPSPMPEDVTALANRIDRAMSKVKRLLDKPEQKPKRQQYLATLLSHATRGLTEGDVKSAVAAVEGFEAEFVGQEGPAFRAKHVTATLVTAFWTMVVLVGLWSAAQLVATFLPSIPHSALALVATIVAIGFGVCLGISFFAFVRNLNLTFDTLGNFDPANLSASLRFALVGIIAVILCILLSSGLVAIEVGDVKLNDFSKDPLVAIILGMICGYSDTAITKTLTGVLAR